MHALRMASAPVRAALLEAISSSLRHRRLRCDRPGLLVVDAAGLANHRRDPARERAATAPRMRTASSLACLRESRSAGPIRRREGDLAKWIAWLDEMLYERRCRFKDKNKEEEDGVWIRGTTIANRLRNIRLSNLSRLVDNIEQ